MTGWGLSSCDEGGVFLVVTGGVFLVVTGVGSF